MVAVLQYVGAYRQLRLGNANCDETPSCVHKRMKFLTITRRLTQAVCPESEARVVGVAVPQASAPEHAPPIVPGICWATTTARSMVKCLVSAVDTTEEAVMDAARKGAQESVKCAQGAAFAVGDTTPDRAPDLQAVFNHTVASFGVDACFACQKRTGVKKCQTCQLAHYCSRECQRADWNTTHRSECRPRGELRPLDLVALTCSGVGQSQWSEWSNECIGVLMHRSGDGNERQMWRIRKILSLGDFVAGPERTVCETEIVHSPYLLRRKRCVLAHGKCVRDAYFTIINQ